MSQPVTSIFVPRTRLSAFALIIDASRSHRATCARDGDHHESVDLFSSILADRKGTRSSPVHQGMWVDPFDRSAGSRVPRQIEIRRCTGASPATWPGVSKSPMEENRRTDRSGYTLVHRVAVPSGVHHRPHTRHGHAHPHSTHTGHSHRHHLIHSSWHAHSSHPWVRHAHTGRHTHLAIWILCDKQNQLYTLAP